MIITFFIINSLNRRKIYWRRRLISCTIFLNRMTAVDPVSEPTSFHCQGHRKDEITPFTLRVAYASLSPRETNETLSCATDMRTVNPLSIRAGKHRLFESLVNPEPCLTRSFWKSDLAALSTWKGWHRSYPLRIFQAAFVHWCIPQHGVTVLLSEPIGGKQNVEYTRYDNERASFLLQ